MPDNSIVVAVYDAHSEAERTVKELEWSGFDLKKLSIVARNPHAEDVAGYNTGDRMVHRGQAGAYWEGVWGRLFGAASFSLPGIGPVLVAVPLAAWIIGVLEHGTAGEAACARAVIRGTHPAELHTHRSQHAGEQHPAR